MKARGVKACWMIRQYAKGWRMSLEWADKSAKLAFWFPTEKDAEKALRKMNIVFIHMEAKHG